MARSVRRASWTLLLLLLAVCAFPASSALSASSRVGTDTAELAVGTLSWTPSAGNVSYGTTFAFHETDGDAKGLSNLGLLGNLTVTGPAGWNKGATATIQCEQGDGVAPTFCEQWLDTAPVAGAYTIANATGQTWTATIDLTPATIPTITSVKTSPDGQTVQVTWKGAPTDGSYWLEFMQYRSNNWVDLVDGTLPASEGTSAVFDHMGLTTGNYSVVVVSRPFDMTKDGPLPASLAYGWAVHDFPFTLKKQLQFMDPVVHGSATASGKTLTIGDLSITGIPPNSAVSLICLSGCTAKVAGTGLGKFDFRVLRNAKVKDRAVAVIRVAKAGYAGFYDRIVFHISASGLIHETRSCMRPGKTTPVACASIK